MKTEQTANLELCLMKRFFTLGSHIVFEVDLRTARYWSLAKDRKSPHPTGLKLDDPGICDAMQCDNHGEITCFELKVTKADFKSGNKLSFIGNRNYFVMPEELFEKVKPEIPSEIGVLVPDEWGGLKTVKNCKRQEMLYDRETVLIAMLTSSSNKTTVSNIARFKPSRVQVPKKKKEPKAKAKATFVKGRHRFARLEDGTIEPLYYENGERRGFYKDENGKWCMDFDRFFDANGCCGQMLVHEGIVEFLEDAPT